VRYTSDNVKKHEEIYRALRKPALQRLRGLSHRGRRHFIAQLSGWKERTQNPRSRDFVNC